MYRRSPYIILFVATAHVLFACSGWAAEVVQGRCIAYSPSDGTIKVEELDTHFTKEEPYGKSKAMVSVFDSSKAKIGIRPEPGDVLRIVYILEGGSKKALKVMNVSKQDLRKK
jgi:hypothetical protein